MSLREKTLEQRLAELEQRLSVAEAILSSLNSIWLTPNEAAKVLGCSAEHIRQIIKQSKTSKQPYYREGVHWIQVGKHYKIHLQTWKDIQTAS